MLQNRRVVPGKMAAMRTVTRTTEEKGEKKDVVPGRQVVDTIVAVGKVPEMIVREIAHPTVKLQRQTRQFQPVFRRGTCHGGVKNGALSNPRRLSLHIGMEGITPRPGLLVIEEVEGRQASMKTRDSQMGSLVLEIGDKLSPSRVTNIANQIVATFVIHGNGWKDRQGRLHPRPVGHPPIQPKGLLWRSLAW